MVVLSIKTFTPVTVTFAVYTQKYYLAHIITAKIAE